MDAKVSELDKAQRTVKMARYYYSFFIGIGIYELFELWYGITTRKWYSIAESIILLLYIAIQARKHQRNVIISSKLIADFEMRPEH